MDHLGFWGQSIASIQYNKECRLNMPCIWLYILIFGVKKLIIGNHRLPQFHSPGQWSFPSPQSTKGQPLMNGLNECATANGNAFGPMVKPLQPAMAVLPETKEKFPFVAPACRVEANGEA
ncbi:MAG: hypothetical protein K9L59_18340 [Desulfobacterales bacterium]|nr:hypothetical protein [Desulfobacterales bacterium]